MEMDKKQCRVLYWKLLNIIENPIDSKKSSIYIRKFYETSECDEICKDFSSLRNDIKSYMNASDYDKDDSLNRILTFYDIERDREKARQCIYHYSFSHRKQLLSSLSWSRWFYYWTMFKPKQKIINFKKLTLKMTIKIPKDE